MDWMGSDTSNTDNIQPFVWKTLLRTLSIGALTCTVFLLNTNQLALEKNYRSFERVGQHGNELLHLRQCLPSTDDVRIAVESSKAGLFVRAETTKCSRPFVGAGCRATWSVDALRAHFTRLSPAWSGDARRMTHGFRPPKHVSQRNYEHSCMHKHGLSSKLVAAFQKRNLTSATACTVSSENITARYASSCAVVGGSPRLVDEPRADEIDDPEHELVFRYNMHKMDALHSGKRVDVWVVNQLFAHPVKIREKTGFDEVTDNTADIMFMQIAIRGDIFDRFTQAYDAKKFADDASRCAGHLLVSPAFVMGACALASGAISTGQLGLFLAASMCRNVDAYGFTTPSPKRSLYNATYTYADKKKGTLFMDNSEIMQMTFTRLLHCIGLIRLHGLD